MTGGGACDDDMPTFPRTAPGEIPPVGDPAYDALLARTLAPEDAPTGLRPVAQGFAALYEAPVNVEPAAEKNALAAFRAAVGKPVEPAHPRRRRHPVLTSLLSAKLAAAAAAAAVTLGGGAVAAAYAGKLPAPVQKLAHDTIGAPKTPGAPTAHPATPQPTVLPGHSAYGLCTAYANLKAHGTAAQKVTAFRKLAAVAGGAHVSAYCATVTHPGNPGPGQPSRGATSAHPTGKPSTLPSQAQHTHPAGKPTTPSSHAPKTHPTGRPTSTP